VSIPPRPDLPPEGEPGPPPATWKAIETLPIGLIALGATALVAAVLVAVFPSPAIGGDIRQSAAAFAFANMFQEIFIIGSVVFWIRYVNHGSVLSLGLPPRQPMKDIGVGVATAVGMLFASGLVLVAVRALVDVVTGHAVSSPEQVPQTVTGGYLAVTGVVVVLLAPLAEETLFRGFLYKALRRRFRVGPAAVISALFFGLVHFQGLRFLLIIPSLMVVGVALALAYERRQSLFASVVAHATFNLLGFLTIVWAR
jgi:membrane protease YdiL (CAAX protease family)